MKIAYVNANIIDGVLTEDKKLPVREGTVIVENGKFSEIAYSDTDLSACEIKDLHGAYLMPGLINAHVHLASPGSPDKSKKKENSKPVDYKKLFQIGSKFPLIMAIYKKIQMKNATNELLSGVTTIRAVGGILDFDSQIRDKINAGKMIGPRILACNTAVSVPGGHFAGSLATEAETPEDAVNDVRKIIATNPDWIKLMITGGVMDATEDGVLMKMSPEIVRAACDEAHENGYRVCAHVESSEGIRVALENGVDTIEHGAPLSEELIKLFKEKNAAYICTFSPVIPSACFDESVDAGGIMNKKLSVMVAEGMKEGALKCIEENIPLGLGTDAGCPWTTHYNTWREICYFIQFLKVSPDMALYYATKANADILGIGDITGTIEKGKSADFIITEENPLENPKTLSSLRMVCSQGRVIENPRPKKNEIAETELDKVLTI